MKAWVIKNKEGKYLSGYSENESWFEAKYFETNKLTEACLFEDENCEYINLEENEKIVPITIAEGDLEKALDLACEELKCRDENKTHAKLVIQQIKNKWLGENVDYKDWFIQQAKEENDV